MAIARTYLFVPGDRPDRFDKAWSSRADEIIVDLEDAVPADRKAVARESIRTWLRPDRRVWVRCNAVDTPWFAEDLQLLHDEGLAGVFVPKAEHLPSELLRVAETRGIGLIPIIETAQGYESIRSLASAAGVVRLAFGSLDFQVDLGIEGDDDALLYFRSELVLASRLASLPSPIDGITPSIDDTERLRSDTLRARRLGLGAKLCIHPHQVPVIHEVFAPTSEERSWALRILEVMNSSAGGAVSLDGKMVDRPVWLRALKISEAPSATECQRL
ncbi:CoA ester lyase [Trinickia violacea]|uniref:CoA ester lyase n=1 Tax=Trinickia violacea TaxID=2571746 RepID=A0A4P8J0P8_9BURK|nr:CoA ester lyase [Trinickia violacea]QCP54327.1 CoA ester lyase [Trinickia violacea]